jgi:hypothetical protein
MVVEMHGEETGPDGKVAGSPQGDRAPDHSQCILDKVFNIPRLRKPSPNAACSINGMPHNIVNRSQSLS